MNKFRNIMGLMMGVALTAGCGICAPEKHVADETPAAVSKPTAAPTAATAIPSSVAPAAAPVTNAADEVIFADEFNDAGKLGEWVNVNGVGEKDVADGHLLMVNNFKKDAEGDPTTSLVYSIGDYEGNIAIEVKFDEFAPNENCFFMLNLVNGEGSGSTQFSRWSAQKKESLNFQVIADGKPKVLKSVDYLPNSGVMKLQLTTKTGEIRAFCKETPNAQYTEVQGSPCVVEGFKQGPFTFVLQCFNFNPGGPASAKVDFVRITSPKS